MKRLLAFFLGTSIVALFIATAPYVLAYAPAVNVGFLRDLFRLQEHFTIEEKGPRILLISGSNGLYGLDGALLERQTGKRVVNYAVHAGLDLDIYTERLRPNLRSGDIVIAPLEHAFYRRDKLTGYEQQQYLAWMQYEFDLFRPMEQVRYNAAIPSEIYLWFAWSYFSKSRENFDPGDRASVAKRWSDQQQGQVPASGVVFNLSLFDRYGVIYADRLPSGLAETWYTEKRTYPIWKFANIPSRSFDTFNRLETLAKERGATVYYTWPAEIMHAKNFPENTKDIDSRRKFAGEFKKAGYDMICEPSDVILPYGMFNDTHYHLNGLGATARTVALVKCLAGLGLSKPLPPEVVARPATLDQFAALARLRVQRGAKGFEIEQAALALADIRADLDAAAASGTLRASPDWQELIVDQSPLPDAAAAKLSASKFVNLAGDNPPGRIRFKSDGRDYKIVVTDVSDCELMRTVLPAVVDPKRKRECAIGIWSAGAAAW